MKATYLQYMLGFKRPSGTSRGVMTERKPGLSYLKDGKKGGLNVEFLEV
jgi:hypothetical protein